eukprot:689922-Amphidinium_carterae.1
MQVLNEVCATLRRAGVLADVDCPEAIVGSAFPLYRELWSSRQGGLPLAEGRARNAQQTALRTVAQHGHPLYMV